MVFTQEAICIGKYFTLEEAEYILPELQGGIRKLLKLKRAITLLNSIEIDFEDYDYEYNLSNLRLNKKYHKLSYDFYKNFELLEAKGCVIKDLDLGLVDFFSKHEGRDIFLCWRYGEKAIRYWHEIYGGYSERKSISQLKHVKQKLKKF